MIRIEIFHLVFWGCPVRLLWPGGAFCCRFDGTKIISGKFVQNVALSNKGGIFVPSNDSNKQFNFNDMNITSDTHTAILIANRFAVAHQSAETAVNALNTLYHNLFADMVDAELKEDILSAMERVRDVVRATDFNTMSEYIKKIPSNETPSTKISSDEMVKVVVDKYKNACKLYQHAKTNAALSCHGAQMDAFSQTLISFGFSHAEIAEFSK